MDALRKQVMSELRQSREELLTEKKVELTFPTFARWWTRWALSFRKADGIGASPPIEVNLQHFLAGHERATDVEVLADLRSRAVGLLDDVISSVDSKEPVRPVLEELIRRVRDPKLSALLSEFNKTKETTPNFAALGFRTILAPIIR